MPRPLRPQRRRIFVGCEGESERSYVALLQRFCEARNVAVHLDAQVLSGTGGDASKILEKAASAIARREKACGVHAFRFVLLDSDVTVARSGEAELARLSEGAARSGIGVVWQRCCHEALLLRHLPGCQGMYPPDADDAMRRLLKRIPAYRKAWPARRLGEVITFDDVRRAAAVEPQLRAMLEAIGLT